MKFVALALSLLSSSVFAQSKLFFDLITIDRDDSESRSASERLKARKESLKESAFGGRTNREELSKAFQRLLPGHYDVTYTGWWDVFSSNWNLTLKKYDDDHYEVASLGCSVYIHDDSLADDFKIAGSCSEWSGVWSERERFEFGVLPTMIVKRVAN